MLCVTVPPPNAVLPRLPRIVGTRCDGTPFDPFLAQSARQSLVDADELERMALLSWCMHTSDSERAKLMPGLPTDARQRQSRARPVLARLREACARWLGFLLEYLAVKNGHAPR